MSEEVLKEFSGHSGSKVYLVKNSKYVFVRKVSNTDRNIERLITLYNQGYKVPRILHVGEEYLDMEYIHGLDMTSFLNLNSVDELKVFLTNTFNSFAFNTVDKDYTLVYHDKLNWMQDGIFPFSKEELIDRLPSILPQSVYHGDFTLENIIYSNDSFYMIDPLTSDYDSYIFDIVKLRQDLECGWFIRNKKVNLDVKLQSIQDTLLEQYPICRNDNLLILMLLRVYPYTKKNSSNRKFIMKEVNRLWK